MPYLEAEKKPLDSASKQKKNLHYVCVSLANVFTSEERLLNRHYLIEDMSKLYLLPFEATREVQLNPALQTPS